MFAFLSFGAPTTATFTDAVTKAVEPKLVRLPEGLGAAGTDTTCLECETLNCFTMGAEDYCWLDWGEYCDNPPEGFAPPRVLEGGDEFESPAAATRRFSSCSPCAYDQEECEMLDGWEEGDWDEDCEYEVCCRGGAGCSDLVAINTEDPATVLNALNDRSGAFRYDARSSTLQVVSCTGVILKATPVKGNVLAAVQQWLGTQAYGGGSEFTRQAVSATR